MRTSKVAILMIALMFQSPLSLTQNRPSHQRRNAPIPAVKPSPVPIRYIAGRKPHVTVTWSWREIEYNRTYQYRTPRGSVSVRILPNRDSKRPPGHDAEITHSYTDMPVVIHSPKALSVLVEVGDGPGYIDAAYIQVDGRATTIVRGPVWLKGGRHILLVTYPDAE